MGRSHEILRHIAAPTLAAPSQPNCFRNWVGLETDARFFVHAAQLAGTIRPELPSFHHGDNVYGGFAEYLSLATAIFNAKNTLTVVELGAGWGPWISAAGLASRRLGFTDVKLVGVEADPQKLALMQEHCRRNGLASGDGFEIRMINAAAWSRDEDLHFPQIGDVDWGGAAARSGGMDYRGHDLPTIKVAGRSIETICAGLGIVDYMHWDIQGAEREVAMSSIAFLNENVRRIFIGTHSRSIEGELMELFFANGWNIVH